MRAAGTHRLGGQLYRLTFSPTIFPRRPRRDFARRLGERQSALSEQRQDEILVDQIFNHAGGGLASNYDDLAYVIVATSRRTRHGILQLARYSNDFLDESFANGSDGNLFEYEIIYYQTKTVDGNAESLKSFPSATRRSARRMTNLRKRQGKYRWNYAASRTTATRTITANSSPWPRRSASRANFLNTIGP